MNIGSDNYPAAALAKAWFTWPEKLCPVCGGKMRDQSRRCHEYCAGLRVVDIVGEYFSAAEIEPLRTYIIERLEEMYPRRTWRECWADRLERWAAKLR